MGATAPGEPERTQATEIPRPGPPAPERPPGAATARPGEARKLNIRPREPEDVALAVPRAILSVPRFVLVGVFWPVSKLLGLLDDRVLARVRRVFLWNRAETIGWRPALEFQGGYGLSGGARLFHKDLFGHGEQAHVDALFGGLYLQAYEVRLRGDSIGGTRVVSDLRGRYDVSPGLVFQGLGESRAASSRAADLDPDTYAVRTRYSQRRALGLARVGYRFGPRNREIRPGVGVLFNHRRFGRDRRRAVALFTPDDRDPSIEDVYDVDRLTGFREGVDVARVFGSLEIDTRNHRGRASRGLHFIGLGGGAPPQARGVAFGHYGSELTAYFNLFRHTRILFARVGLEAVHGDDARIPFSELPRLGGPLRLRGYRLNRFRGRKAVLGTLEYRYPIHDAIAGHLFVDGGRVASTYRDLVSGDVRPWRLGYGGGFTFRTLERWYMRIDLSYGDEFLVFFSTDPLQAFSDHHVLEL